MEASTNNKALLDFLQVEGNHFLADEDACTCVEKLSVRMTMSCLSTMSNLWNAFNHQHKVCDTHTHTPGNQTHQLLSVT